ncbi:MAG TPA: DNA translocase FtsK 4TM domain-containing protein, partial [Rhizomicrobium sp.]
MASRIIGGVYHPRAKGSAMSDALADARQALNRLLKMLAMRGAGLALVLAAGAALAALASYSPDDASLNNANLRDVSNWLGPLGAVAADLLLQIFGLATLAFLAPLFVWGARALRGKSLKYAMWRLLAWPLGTLTVAAGLGLFPRPASLPAGMGGMIGIAAAGLSAHAAQVWHTPAVGWALPLGLLVAGLPLAFLATGLRFLPILRGAMNIPAAFVWAGGLLKKPDFGHHDEDDGDHEYEDDDEGAYHLDAPNDSGAPGAVRPEPIAGTRAADRLAERQKSRVKRDAAKPQPKRADAQPALNLSSGEYQLPGLDLLSEPPPHKDTHTLSDEALEENARMLEAVLTDFGVKGRITAVRPGPVVTLYEFEPAAGVKS